MTMIYVRECRFHSQKNPFKMGHRAQFTFTEGQKSDSFSALPLCEEYIL